MSANSWAVCPKCLKIAKAQKEAEIKELKDSYGKVSMERYNGLKIEADQPLLDSEETLREDYEIFMSFGGKLEVDYSCHCDKCGFKHIFTHEEKATI